MLTPLFFATPLRPFRMLFISALTLWILHVINTIDLRAKKT